MNPAAYILTGDNMRIEKIKRLLQLVGACGAIIICLRYGNECARGIFNGILFCIEILVPSLFLLMCLSAYLVKSGIALRLSKPLGGIARAIFRLPYASMAALLPALIGGYPVGARCTALLYERGLLTKKQAEKTAMTAVCAGPGFLVNFVGRALMRSAEMGILLLTAELVGVAITGFIIGRTIPCEEDTPRAGVEKQPSNLLVDAVYDASRATFCLCGAVVLCAALIEVITTVSPDKSVTDLLSAAVEITSGCSVLCEKLPPSFIAFFIGFGGLSVHLQIFAAAGTIPLRKGLFFLFRAIQGMITAVLTYTLLLLFSPQVGVFNSADVELTAAKTATLAGSAALVLCSLYFSASVNKLRKQHG